MLKAVGRILRDLSLVYCLIAVASVSVAAAAPASFDLVITNGHIIDGTGSPWYSGDMGIRNGKIAAIGNLTDAARTRTIDAQGMVVAPGIHRHAGAVGADDPGGSAAAVEDLPGHHDGDHGRRQFGGAAE